MERRAAGPAGMAGDLGLPGPARTGGAGLKAGLPGLWEWIKAVGRWKWRGVGKLGRCRLCGLLPEYMDYGRCGTCWLKPRPMGGRGYNNSKAKYQANAVVWRWGNSIQSDGLVMRLMGSLVKLFGGVMGFGTVCCVSNYNPTGVWYDVKEYWGCRNMGYGFGLSWVEVLVVWGVVCDV